MPKDWFLGTLAIVFITLKLCNVIDWSWILVLSPIWLPFIIVSIMVLPIAVKEYKEKKKC